MKKPILNMQERITLAQHRGKVKTTEGAFLETKICWAIIIREIYKKLNKDEP